MERSALLNLSVVRNLCQNLFSSMSLHNKYTATPVTLTLLGTSACHLCDEAEAIIYDAFALQGQAVKIEHCDISESNHLIEIYGLRIPVVHYNGKELDWPFNGQQLFEFIAC